MTFEFNPQFPDATNEQKWEQIKLWRNAQLLRSDWTMHTDAPTDKVKWAAYRKALRDLPAQGGSADKAEFPNEPEKL
jgi:hypothetical protein